MMLTREEMEGSIFEGDCLEVMRSFPDDSVDMVLCDLPYGTTRSKWDSVIDLNELWTQYRRIVKPAGAIVLTSAGPFTCQLGVSAPDLFKYKWVWVKSQATNFLNAKKQPLRKHEDVCVFYKNPPVYHPQMTEGKPYVKNEKPRPTPACYGSFMRCSATNDGSRYPTDVLYFNSVKNRGGGRRTLPPQPETCGFGKVSDKDLYRPERSCSGQLIRFWFIPRIGSAGR